METTARAHKQTTCPGNHPRSTPQKPMFRTSVVTCSRTHQGMDPDGLENGGTPKKSHQRSQSTGCVLVRKAQTTPHSQATAPQAKDRWGLQGRPRWGFKRHPRQGVNVKSTWSGCQAKQVGNLSLFALLRPSGSHTRSHGLSSPTTENILCGGDPPRGLSDETTSLGTMATAMESQLQPFNTSNLDDFCSANDFQKGSKGVVQQGELQGFWLQAIQQHLPKALDFIVVSFFRWPCYQIQADTPVDVWSNHACQVALFFPSVRTACSGGSIRSSPASGNAPLGNQGTREPTGGILSKVGQ